MVYSAIPLGSSLMCLRFLQVAWAFWKTGELPQHDHAHVEGVDADSPHAASPLPGADKKPGGT
jgi:C4-dicarboxylate transporter DctQ subunit